MDCGETQEAFLWCRSKSVYLYLSIYIIIIECITKWKLNGVIVAFLIETDKFCTSKFYHGILIRYTVLKFFGIDVWLNWNYF